MKDNLALCDIDQQRLETAAQHNLEVKTLTDYRKTFDEAHREFDVVFVGTRDHHQSPASIVAIKHAKHVYTEKPLAHSIYEARRPSGPTSTTGAGGWPRARKSITPTIAVEARESTTLTTGADVGTWVPAPGGDIGCHAMAPAFWALKLDKPTAVEAEYSPSNEEMFPECSILTYQFPARGDLPPAKLVWYDGGKKPPRPPEMEAGRDLGDNGFIYVGDRGTILDHRIIPEEKMRQVKPPEKTIPRMPGHHEDFFIACRGGRPACSNFDFAGNPTEAALVGNVAIRAGRRIEWDGENMKPKNCSDPDMLRVIRREYRGRWSLQHECALTCAPLSSMADWSSDNARRGNHESAKQCNLGKRGGPLVDGRHDAGELRGCR